MPSSLLRRARAPYQARCGLKFAGLHPGAGQLALHASGATVGHDLGANGSSRRPPRRRKWGRDSIRGKRGRDSLSAVRCCHGGLRRPKKNPDPIFPTGRVLQCGDWSALSFSPRLPFAPGLTHAAAVSQGPRESDDKSSHSKGNRDGCLLWRLRRFARRAFGETFAVTQPR